jgi:hypothetical protein
MYLPFFLSMLLVANPTPQGDARPATNLKVSGEAQEAPATRPEMQSVAHFCGKITKSRVRMRLKPYLDSPILKELNRDDLVVVVGQADDFWAVKPTPGTKGYVYRTYILDGEIVGSHVNVRLEPDSGGHIACQLNEGEKISGSISSQNTKWFEIALPEYVTFYVAKEYVTKIGDETLFSQLAAKKIQLEEKLKSIAKTIENEFKKSFEEIDLSSLAGELNQIIDEKDFPKIAESGKELLQKMREEYLQKSMAAKNSQNEPSKEPLATNEQKTELDKDVAESVNEAKDEASSTTTQDIPLVSFDVREKDLVAYAISTKQAANADIFYQQEEHQSMTISGVVKPYTKQVKNSPGDYLLISTKTGMPQCFLYSSKVHLQDFVGKEVTFVVVERPNNNFAWPAYFVLRAQ